MSGSDEGDGPTPEEVCFFFGHRWRLDLLWCARCYVTMRSYVERTGRPVVVEGQGWVMLEDGE